MVKLKNKGNGNKFKMTIGGKVSVEFEFNIIPRIDEEGGNYYIKPINGDKGWFYEEFRSRNNCSEFGVQEVYVWHKNELDIEIIDKGEEYKDAGVYADNNAPGYYKYYNIHISGDINAGDILKIKFNTPKIYAQDYNYVRAYQRMEEQRNRKF